MTGFARWLVDVWCVQRHRNPKHNTKYTLVYQHHVFTHVLNSQRSIQYAPIEIGIDNSFGNSKKDTARNLSIQIISQKYSI